jgi:hypothetical protein
MDETGHFQVRFDRSLHLALPELTCLRSTEKVSLPVTTPNDDTVLPCLSTSYERTVILIPGIPTWQSSASLVVIAGAVTSGREVRRAGWILDVPVGWKVRIFGIPSTMVLTACVFRYPNIMARMLKMRLIPEEAMNEVTRVISYEFMNRQLVWTGFTVRR